MPCACRIEILVSVVRFRPSALFGFWGVSTISPVFLQKIALSRAFTIDVPSEKEIDGLADAAMADANVLWLV